MSSTGSLSHRSNANAPSQTSTSMLGTFRSAASTLLSALENLLLIDEQGHSKPSQIPSLHTSLHSSADSVAAGSKRRGSERSLPTLQIPDVDGMDVDVNVDRPLSRHELDSPALEEVGMSPLKRKRATSGFPLPDPKSHRISASLSSRLQRSLQVADHEIAEDRDRNSSPDLDTHLDSPVPTWTDSGLRRLSRLPRSESFDSARDITASPAISTSSMSHSRAMSRTASRNKDLDRSSISSWIESQALRNGQPLEAAQANWDEKKREFEYNLNLLANGVPSDSYQDLRAITEKIVEAARLLSAGNLDELGDLVPVWRASENNIDNVVSYIKIVEDMKATTLMSFHVTGDLDDDLIRMKQCLDQKRSLWGTVLVDDAAAWKTLGFPVDELQELLSAAAGWIYGLPWSLLVQLDGELHKLRATGTGHHPDPAAHAIMERVFSGLLFAQDCAEFVGRPFQQRVLNGAYSLTSAFFIFTLTLYEQLSQRSVGKARSAEVRVMQLFGNLVKLLEALRALKGTSGHDRDYRHGKRRARPPTATPTAGDVPRGRSNYRPPRHSLHSPLSPDSNDAAISPVSNVTADHLPGHLEALDELSRVIVEAGLQICEYVATRHGKADATHQAGTSTTPLNAGKNVLVLVVAVRYVQDTCRLAGTHEADKARLQRLVDRLPPGGLT
ncbi:hypothetical protein HKX48_009584 [Thoreauomyces humboldtii]|nr:hypothetical protein HKX48_009584 [Thoreauomyces humboldtii]